jgi:hypothetical protein
MLGLLKRHWFDLGSMLAAITLLLVLLLHPGLSAYQTVLWLSFASLCLHQMEEYRIPGTFPGMINSVMFKSDRPDRYPLNMRSAMVINTGLGWCTYLLAALFAERTVWLGIATVLISLGNVVAHTFLFNIKGRSVYNAGMATCWLFFVPIAFFFFHVLYSEQLASTSDWAIGLPLGILLNVAVLKSISWLKDPATTDVFPRRSLLPKDH